MNGDPYKYFRIEAQELLQALEAGVMQLAQGSPESELVSELLRIAHTLKGAARVVRESSIAEASHAIEDVLELYRTSSEAVSTEQVKELFRLLECIETGLANLRSPATPSLAPTALAGADNDSYSAAVSSELETVRVDIEELDGVLNSLTESSVSLGAVRKQAEGIKRIRQLVRRLVEEASSDTPNGPGDRIRDLADDLAGSLERLDRGIVACIDRAEQELAESRDRADHLLLLPARVIFPALAAAVQDAAQALEKSVTFTSTGGEIQLDTNVLPLLREALLHVVRNAVAHGIESARGRAEAGKPLAGNVYLEVMRRGSIVVIRCRDDGRGLEVEAIRQAALKRGMLQGDRPDSFTMADAVELLLKGGVSTSRAADAWSGRGIGLNVVRKAAAGMEGNVSIESAPGQGTTVELTVGVSLAAVPALLVESAGSTYAIPADSIRRTLLLLQRDIVRSGGSESVQIDDTMVPFFVLQNVMEQGVIGHRQQWCTALVGSGTELAAVGVDHLQGLKTVFMRQIPSIAAAHAMIAGTSLDQAGNPLLVLDPAGLIAAGAQWRTSENFLPEAAPKPVLVIDDSLTTRMLEQSILEAAGYTVELASSAEEALAKVAQRRYSLFLVDVEMPGMDGFEFVTRMRADVERRNIPAILVTSRNSPEDRRRGEQAGAAAYIVKSEFDQAELLKTIRRLVSQR